MIDDKDVVTRPAADSQVFETGCGQRRSEMNLVVIRTSQIIGTSIDDEVKEIAECDRFERDASAGS